MAFLNLTRSRPDKHTHRTEWNESWEVDLKIYETFRENLPQIDRRQVPHHSFRDRNGVDITLGRMNESFHHDIFTLQDDACRRATARLAADDFEEKWTKLEASRRREYILDAIYKTCIAGPDTEGYRQWCPDIIVESLAKEGSSYIDLLMFLIDSRAELQAVGRQELVFFPHPIVDMIFTKINDIEGDTYYKKVRMDRCFFITMVIWGTYLAFYGLSEVYRYDTTGVPSKKQAKKAFARATAATGTKSHPGNLPKEECSEAYLRGKLAEFLNLDKIKGEDTCWTCGKTERLLPSGTKLCFCSECKKIHRTVLYCSRKCQKLDWKDGIAPHRPHKYVCGRPFVESKSPVQIPSSTTIKPIPAPDVAFKRSPALLYQIRMLQKDNDADYFFVCKHPEPDLGIAIPIPLRSLFLAWRQRALRNGDVVAVKSMYSVLQIAASKLAPSSYSLKSQLEKEYGVTLGEPCDVGDLDRSNLTASEKGEAANLLFTFDGVSRQL